MKLHKMLGIQYPIIQGGMANIATGEFAAAVSNAGALGTIGAGGMTVEMLAEQIQICRQKTSKPFAVNIMLMNPDAPKMAELVIKEKIPVVTTGAGNPSIYMENWKKEGIFIFPVVPSVALAKRMEKYGADGVIVEGTESGGHVGELTTMALLPQVCDALSIPVIAAGGIASGRQMLASEILGACGVQVGTCLLVSEECPVHENYKQAVLKAKDSDTVVTGRQSGVPVRGLKNKMTRQFIKLEKDTADKMELEKLTLGSLRKAVFDGDIENGSLMAGQVAGLLKEIQPLHVIFENLKSEYEESYQKLVRSHE